MSRRVSRRSFLALSSLTVACSRSAQGLQAHIVVGGQTDLVYLSTTLAQQIGAFDAAGVKVEIEDTGAGSKSLQAILSGSADVASGFYDHTIQMAAEGKAIKAFVNLTRYPGAVLVASPAGAKRINSVKDLKGANVGVTAPGSSSHFFLNHVLVKNGLAPTDISVVAMGGGRSRVAALENSKVDAGVLFEPGISFLMKRAPQCRILVDARTPQVVADLFGTPEYPSAVLYAKAEWLQRNPETARALAKAMRQTLNWIAQHSPAEIAAKMPDAFRGEDSETYLQALERAKPMHSQDGIMRQESAEAVKRVLGLSVEKVRIANPDVASTYTNDFLN